MRAKVVVTSRAEQRAVEVAMQDPAVRAFVVICGILKDLPSDRARLRVLGYVQDLATDPDTFPTELEPALPLEEVGDR
jgi:hypothetical protein